MLTFRKALTLPSYPSEGLKKMGRHLLRQSPVIIPESFALVNRTTMGWQGHLIKIPECKTACNIYH